MKPSRLTHADLCKLAVAWLRRPASKTGPGCLISVSETRASAVSETPDAFGVRYSDTVLIEAKVSRADFLADRGKPFRASGGMGLYRYYLTPAGLIRPQELPAKWGLLEVSPRGAIVAKRGHVIARSANFGSDMTPELADWRHARDCEAELAFVSRLLARVGDVEEMNRQIKAAQHMAAAAARRCEKLEKQNLRLLRECSLLRVGEDGLAPARPTPQNNGGRNGT